jgi:hypothetical protein
MFQIKAQVLNTFTTPATDKRPEGFKVQLLGDSVTKDGQVRKEMVTISCPPDIFDRLSNHLGKTVTMPVGIFAVDGRIQPYFPKHGAGLSGAENEA